MIDLSKTHQSSNLETRSAKTSNRVDQTESFKIVD